MIIRQSFWTRTAVSKGCFENWINRGAAQNVEKQKFNAMGRRRGGAKNIVGKAANQRVERRAACNVAKRLKD
jgi:hypothetical protein